MQKHSVPIDLSLSRDRTFVHKTLAAENALSALTDDGGILSIVYPYPNSRPRPRLPFDSNIAISPRMVASWDFSTSTESVDVEKSQLAGVGNHRLGQ